MRDSITAADIAAYRDFSLETFGPGPRNEAKFKHLAEELDEAREESDQHRGVDRHRDSRAGRGLSERCLPGRDHRGLSRQVRQESR